MPFILNIDNALRDLITQTGAIPPPVPLHQIVSGESPAPAEAPQIECVTKKASPIKLNAAGLPTRSI